MVNLLNRTGAGRHMMREETDREDLLREASALVERVEFTATGFAAPIVAGFRRNGALSLFFDADPVYQFNTTGELRRAFRQGHLIKAENRRLFELKRTRNRGQTVLLKSELDSAATEQLLGELTGKLTALLQQLSACQITIVGQVPPAGNVVPRLTRVLAAIASAPVVIATAPNAV